MDREIFEPKLKDILEDGPDGPESIQRSVNHSVEPPLYYNPAKTSVDANKQGTKNRTPSGNFLQKSVSELKGLFCDRKQEAENFEVVWRDNSRGSPGIVRQRQLSRRQRGVKNSTRKRLKEKAELIATSKGRNGPVISQQTMASANMIETADSMSVEKETANCNSNTVSDQREMGANGKENNNLGATAEIDINTLEGENDSRMEVHDTEVNDNPNPSGMDVIAVKEMMENLSKEFSALKTEVRNSRVEKEVIITKQVIDQCKARISKEIQDDMTKYIDHEMNDVKALKEELKHFKYRNRALTDTVERLHVEMEDLKLRLENVEASGQKTAISISGLNMSGTKAERAQHIEAFVYDYLGITVNVQDHFLMGASDPKLTIVYLQNMKEKREVMRYKYCLKNVKNQQGKSIYINDYTPVNLQEKRHREFKIRIDNDNREQPLKIEYLKGKMVIQGETYIRKVTPPSPKAIVDMSSKELKAILDMDILQSGKVTQDKSIFQGYIASVSNHQQIRDLYVKTRMLQPTARHVVCAYIIKGEQTHYCQDYCDDGEPGAGRHLLEFMTQNNLQSKVIL